jgi:citrate synthase
MSEAFWKTSMSAVEQNKILIKGYRVQDLMEHCSFGDIVYLTFRGELPAGNEGRMIEMILTSSTDHSFLAPSVDATRFAASGGVPLQAAVAAGMIALGEHHGGAIEQCARTLQEGVRSGASAVEIIRGFKERKLRVPGIGHPIHTSDPRTVKLAAKAREWKLAGAHLTLAEAIAAEIRLPLNIDGAIAGITSDIGISWHYGKSFFLISRAVGLAAHAVEEVIRERPFRAIDLSDVSYDGPAERDLPDRFRKGTGT